MIEGLQRFVAGLREAGVAVSPAEWLEALRAVDAVGLADRDRVRAALACTLVKRAAQRATFERLFDAFFAAPRGSRGGRRRGGTGAGGRAERPRGERPLAGPRDRPAPERAPSRAKALASRLDGLRHGARPRDGRLRSVVVADPGAESGGPPFDPRRPARAPTPARRELARSMPLDDERAVAEEIPRLVRRIRLRSGRRLVRRRRGRLHLRAVFRRNAAYGGVPFVLPRQRRRPRRARVVLLIDVSWSAARSAGLFLALAGEFLRRARDTRVLAFVDRPVEVTTAVERWLRAPAAAPRPWHGSPSCKSPGAGIVRGGRSFAALLADVPELNLTAPSDFGRAFHALLQSPRRPAGRGTVLVVLGDGRSNRFDPQTWAFEELAQSCGAVLWLVSEPRGRWGTADSRLDAYAPYVDCLVEARDLAGLARGVRELLHFL